MTDIKRREGDIPGSYISLVRNVVYQYAGIKKTAQATCAECMWIGFRDPELHSQGKTSLVLRGIYWESKLYMKERKDRPLDYLQIL